MANFKVIISEEAERDLRDIYSYIARILKEPSVADKLLEKIDAGILSLADMPQRHNIVMDVRLSHKQIRKLTIDNYMIFYLINENSLTVQIVRVLYARRDWIHVI